MTASDLQNEAIVFWRNGELFAAYQLLQSIPSELWVNEGDQITQQELLSLLEEQIRQKYFGTQAEELVRMVQEEQIQ